MGKLTIRRRKFCEIYFNDGEAAQAYIDAGFSATNKVVAEANARRLLKDNSVSAYLRELMEKSQSEKVASAKEILEFYTAAMRGEIKEEVVIVESIGDFMSEARIVQKQISISERNKAAKELAKRYALDKPTGNEEKAPIIILNDLPMEEEGVDDESN